jgi:hypothetical protein
MPSEQPRAAFAVKLGIAIVIGAGGVAACLAILVFCHVNTQLMSPEQAATAMAEVRAHLLDARPLLDVDAQLQVVVHRAQDASRRPIAALHTITYTPRTHKYVRADFPVWLLRLATFDGRFRLLNIDIIQKDGERITLADLERHGPGLILDAPLSERRMLVWTE